MTPHHHRVGCFEIKVQGCAWEIFAPGGSLIAEGRRGGLAEARAWINAQALSVLSALFTHRPYSQLH